MAASIAEIGRQVQESSQISGEAVGQAQKTDERITKLAQAASRIGDVTQLITTIAEQTNLLALNATIEAARAGEAGKGFAVVAQEVKQLAAQTAKATSEISGQIAEMQAATQDSVTAIKEIGGTIGRISEIATTIAAAVEEQGAATQEITRNIQQAATGTAQVAGQHLRGERRRGQDRHGVGGRAVGGEVAVRPERPPQDRGGQVPRDRARRVGGLRVILRPGEAGLKDDGPYRATCAHVAPPRPCILRGSLRSHLRMTGLEQASAAPEAELQALDPAAIACHMQRTMNEQFSPNSAAAPRVDRRVAARPRGRAPAHVCDHLPPGRRQDHADREAAAVRRRDPARRPGQGQARPPQDPLGLDGDRARARHLGRHLGDDLRARRPRLQPARHARPRGLLRGYLPHPRRRSTPP